MLPVSGLDGFNERRFLGTLKTLVALLEEHGKEENAKWIKWFEGDQRDYLAAEGQPGQPGRQMAVVEHVMSAFGGMHMFQEVKLLDADGKPLDEANEKLSNVSMQLWSASRGLQGALLAQLQK